MVKSYLFMKKNTTIWNVKLWPPAGKITSWSLTGNMAITDIEYDVLANEYWTTLKRHVYDEPSILGKLKESEIRKCKSFEDAMPIINMNFHTCWKAGGTSAKGNAYGPTIQMRIDLDGVDGTGYPIVQIFDIHHNCVYNYPPPLDAKTAANPVEKAKYDRVVARHVKDYPTREAVITMLGKHVNCHCKFVTFGVSSVNGEAFATAKVKAIFMVPYAGGQKRDIESIPISPFASEAVVPMASAHQDDELYYNQEAANMDHSAYD